MTIFLLMIDCALLGFLVGILCTFGRKLGLDAEQSLLPLEKQSAEWRTAVFKAKFKQERKAKLEGK